MSVLADVAGAGMFRGMADLFRFLAAVMVIFAPICAISYR